MKGLVLKDVYNVRFQMFSGMAILMFPYILMLICGMFDSSEDNILNDEIFGINGGVVMLILLSYVSITMNSSFMLNTIVDDKRSGWAKMQRTMPISSAKIIGAKMIANGVIVGGLTLIVIVVNMIGFFTLDLPLELLITAPLVENIDEIAFRVICYVGISAFTAAVIMASCAIGKKAVERDV